jgi:hypothetical protein
MQWAPVDFGTARDAEVKTWLGEPSGHGVPCTAVDDCAYTTPRNRFRRLVLMSKNFPSTKWNLVYMNKGSHIIKKKN